MRKNAYLITITIITILCIIAGTWWHVIKWGMNVISGLPFLSEMVGDDDTESADNSYSHQGGETYDSFDAISMDISVTDLNIQTGDKYSISYECNREKLVPKFQLDNGTLVVTQSKARHMNFTGSTKCEITITVPADAILQDLNIDGSVGDVDFSGIQTEKSNFDLSVGDVDFTDSALGECTIDTSTGDIDLENCTFDNLKIDTSIGDVDVITAQDLGDYNIMLDTSVGEVSVNGRSHKTHYEVQGGSGKELTVDNSTGDISLKTKN